jgi:hypothetical protein
LEARNFSNLGNYTLNLFSTLKGKTSLLSTSTMSSNRKKDDGRTKKLMVSPHDRNFKRENFIHEHYERFFTRTCSEKKVIPQNAVSVDKLEELHLGEVGEIIKRENLTTFCNLRDAYIEDLVRIFYSGLQEQNGAEFEFCIGKKIFKVSNKL